MINDSPLWNDEFLFNGSWTLIQDLEIDGAKEGKLEIPTFPNEEETLDCTHEIKPQESMMFKTKRSVSPQ